MISIKYYSFMPDLRELPSVGDHAGSKTLFSPEDILGV
jgi:hypothetical protein